MGAVGILRFRYTGFQLVCHRCGAIYEPDPRLFLCPKCGVPLSVEFEEPGPRLAWSELRSRRPGLWQYRELLPMPTNTEPVTMGEGGTPLIRLTRIAALIGIHDLYLKYEGLNPTGSFKDRGMSVAVTIAKSIGARALIAASTGNTAASAAAYAARAGLSCLVVLPEGKVGLGKLVQAGLHGATVIEIKGSFDEALKAVMQVAGMGGKVYPVNSFNPWRLEGQKTIAFEIYDQLDKVPDTVIVPVGNAGNIAAIWKGFMELRRLGVIDKAPRMIGVQAEGAAPLARAVEKGLSTPLFIDKPETVASAIRIGRPVNWPKALKAIRESGGTIIAVSDEAILEAQRDLARREGVGVEPASAAPLAGLRRLVAEGLVEKDETVVLIATGHALKDPGAASLHAPRALKAEDAEDAAKVISRLLEAGSLG